MTVTIKEGKGLRLMGAAEIAELVGVDSSNVNKLVGLPAPVASLKCGQIWFEDDVREFAREREQRRNGRGA